MRHGLHAVEAVIQKEYEAQMAYQLNAVSWLPEPRPLSRTRRILDFLFPGAR